MSHPNPQFDPENVRVDDDERAPKKSVGSKKKNVAKKMSGLRPGWSGDAMSRLQKLSKKLGKTYNRD